jgi:hypothetical protein
VADVHEADHPVHRLGIVQLEGVVNRERIDVDDRGLETGLTQQGDPPVDQLAFGGNEEHVHLQPLGVRIEDLEVQLDVGHVEGDVLLRFPADHVTGFPLAHPVHLDLLDDHVPPADRRDHPFGLDPGGGKEAPDRLRDDAGIHDFSLDDGVRRDFGRGDPNQLRLAGSMVDHDELDDAGADVEPDCGFLATQTE